MRQEDTVTDEQIARFRAIENLRIERGLRGLREFMQDCIDGLDPENETKNIVHVVHVDYGKTLKEMIRAIPFDYVHPDINEHNFPIQLTGVKSFCPELVHPNQEIEGPPSPELLRAPNFRSATLAELLAFCKSYPKEKRKFPVVALGSSWPKNTINNASAPYLMVKQDIQELKLAKCNQGFGSRCRFLVVRL